MRRSWVALSLLCCVQVDSFGVSSQCPTKGRSNHWKNDDRPSAECYPYVVRLASEIDQGSPDCAETMLPDELLVDIAPLPYERNQKWLEEATAELMDLKTFPIGTLTPDDVQSVAGLMAAWVRRRSVDAALMVEELLKRVVDDLRAGNRSIKVTTRMYTIVSEKDEMNVIVAKRRSDLFPVAFLCKGNGCMGKKWSQRGSAKSSAHS